MLQLQILQGKLDASERLNKPPTKLLLIPEIMKQAGWMPIPKPLTEAELKQCSYDADGFMISREQAMRNVEKAHGIGEKE
jgi:hypothetical protein